MDKFRVLIWIIVIGLILLFYELELIFDLVNLLEGLDERFRNTV